MIPMLPVPSQDDPIIECRELTPEEIKRSVEPGFRATGNPLPDPSVSTFIGVLVAGEVVASLGLQVKLHAQPLQISEGYASVLPRLVAKAEEIILGRTGPQWVYLFAPAGRLSQLAQAMGMQLEPWCVLSKLVQPAGVNPVPLVAELPNGALNGPEPQSSAEPWLDHKNDISGERGTIQ